MQNHYSRLIRCYFIRVKMRLKASYTRVYLKTEDVPGSEDFSRCARHFFAGILTYFKEK